VTPCLALHGLRQVLQLLQLAAAAPRQELTLVPISAQLELNLPLSAQLKLTWSPI